jgi:hypothetical protein
LVGCPVARYNGSLVYGYGAPRQDWARMLKICRLDGGARFGGGIP